jgi:hypothetical protein
MAAVLPGWRPGLRAAMIGLLPTTTLCFIAGQNGFLSAALLVGGMRLLSTRPILGGVLLGLLTYKPQLGLLVPVALIASGQWRAMAAATLTVAMLVAASAALIGWDAWTVWLHALSAHAAGFAVDRSKDFMMPTIAAALREAGLSSGDAAAGQLAAAVLAAAYVWFCYRRRADDIALAALCIATFIATPYALFYDLPAFGAAIVFIVAEKVRAARSWTAGETIMLLIASAMPMSLTGPAVPPGVSLGAAVLIGMAVLLLNRHPAPRPATAVHASPGLCDHSEIRCEFRNLNHSGNQGLSIIRR